MTSTQKRRVGKKPRRFSIWSLLMIAAVLGVVYYFYYGVQKSMDEIQATEMKRAPVAQTAPQASPGLTRTQYDQQRTGTYADAVKNSESLKAHQQHVQQTEKAVQQLSNNK